MQDKMKTSLKVGSRVEAIYMNQGNFYPGTIIASDLNHAHFDIRYDDGDIERNVPTSLIREIKQNSKCEGNDGCTSLNENGRCLTIGSRVKARFQGGLQFFPGTIMNCYSNNNKFDILYDDGDKEYGVLHTNISLIDDIQSVVDSKSTKNITETRAAIDFVYSIGQKIHLRIGNIEGSWKEGKIVDVRSDRALVISME